MLRESSKLFQGSKERPIPSPRNSRQLNGCYATLRIRSSVLLLVVLVNGMTTQSVVIWGCTRDAQMSSAEASQWLEGYPASNVQGSRSPVRSNEPPFRDYFIHVLDFSGERRGDGDELTYTAEEVKVIRLFGQGKVSVHYYKFSGSNVPISELFHLYKD